jgi:hypothetical protein
MRIRNTAKYEGENETAGKKTEKGEGEEKEL